MHIAVPYYCKIEDNYVHGLIAYYAAELTVNKVTEVMVMHALRVEYIQRIPIYTIYSNCFPSLTLGNWI